MKVTQKRKMDSLYYGVNAGAFLGIMLCYIGEKISWSWGFGLAGILCSSECCILFHSKYFGDIGLKPTLASKQESKDKAAKVNLAKYRS
jgi:POT family proton-dependent oligopeptide transporter